MALDGKTLKLCNCNKTMALDAKALGAALKLKQPIQIHTELCRKEVGSFHDALKAESCVVACTQEAPLFAELARAGRRGDRARSSSTSAKPPDGRRRARRRRRRSPRCSRWPICPSPNRCRASSYKSGGQLLIIGPARGGARVGGTARGAARSERAHDGRRAGRAAGGAPLSGLVGQGEVGQGLSGRVRGRLGAGQPDRPRSLHALQRLHPRLPGAGDRFLLPDRPGQVQVAPRSASRPAAPSAPSISTAATARAASASIWCSTSRRSRRSARRSRRRAISRRARDPLEQALAAAQLAQTGGRVREAEILRLQREDLRAQPLGESRLQSIASTPAPPARSRPTAITSRSSRTCAWAAAAARPSAPRAR